MIQHRHHDRSNIINVTVAVYLCHLGLRHYSAVWVCPSPGWSWDEQRRRPSWAECCSPRCPGARPWSLALWHTQICHMGDKSLFISAKCGHYYLFVSHGAGLWGHTKTLYVYLMFLSLVKKINMENTASQVLHHVNI